MTRRFVLLFCTVFPAALLVSACGDPTGRKEVTGEVKLEGEPLKEGTIAFVPLEGQDTQGGGMITAGNYRVPRSHGLKPGKYQVRITAGDGKTPATDEEAGAPGGSTNIVSVDLIPPEWNVNSTQQVEVKKDGQNKFDFTIPKKNVVKKKKR